MNSFEIFGFQSAHSKQGLTGKDFPSQLDKKRAV